MQKGSVLDSTKQCAPPLTAKLAPWMKDLLLRSDLVSSLLGKYCAPLHLVVESEFQRNVTDFVAAMKARNLQGMVFFARKANKLPFFVSAANKAGIGVDTASLPELEETLELGLPPERVITTAIGKNHKLISRAVASSCWIVIDNRDELELVASVAREQNRVANIALRFSGFIVGGKSVASRFGFHVSEFNDLMNVVVNDSLLNLKIFHAHLDRYDLSERATAVRKLISFADQAKDMGQKIESIDIGGGVLMRYLDSEAEWSTFQSCLLQSVKGTHPSFTYRGDGLGYVRTPDNQIIGQPDLYPAYNTISKERFVSAILDNDESGTPLHKELSDRGLNLYFEPGRALLDNCGLTFSEVTFRKHDTEGNLLVGLDMNRTNLRPFRAEFCCDPLFIHKGVREETTEGAFLVGNLCSESDLIYRRRINLKKMPLPGDIVCFPNTAGYLAHHMEIGTHGGPLPKNLLIDPSTWDVTGVG